MTARPAAAVVIAVTIAASFGACSDDGDSGAAPRATASALCTALQDWIDGIERTSKELSDRTTADPEPAGAERKAHFIAWADAVLEQTEGVRATLGELELPGGGLAGLDDGVAILRDTREEITAFPEDDPERLGYRISQVFLAMEDVFAKTRTSVEALGEEAGDAELTRALTDEPACRDYNDPLT